MSRKLSPDDAIVRYLKERKPEIAKSTHRNHKYTLNEFVNWTEKVGIEDVAELDGMYLHEFKLYRREQGINEVTLYSNLCTIRVFVQWLESMELVDEGLAEGMMIPDPDDDARDEMITEETAEKILDYLDRFKYGTLNHALFAILWTTGFRIGTVRSLDLDDYYPEEHYIEVVHRPESDTPLKNKIEANREMNLHAWVCEILDDYFEMHRHNVTDDHGRKPLLTTTQGRPARSTFRQQIAGLTRPCHYTGDCPHGRDIPDCEANSYKYAQRCPSSVSPHSLRRAAITNWLNEGHRKELIGDRMNVSPKTLDKHYDARTKGEKRELRREMFELKE